MNLNNKYEYLDKNVIDYINGILRLTTNDDFDEKEFISWLEISDIKNKINPSGYVRKAFKEQFDKGTFRPKPKVYYVPNTEELINQLRDKGICVSANESAFMYVLWLDLINENNVPLEKAKKLNNKIIEYMKEGQSFNDYKELLKKSKTLKPYNLDWEVIEQKVEKFIKDWDKTLDEIPFESEE